MSNFTRLGDGNFAFDLFGSPVRFTCQEDMSVITGSDLPYPITLDKPEAEAAMIIGQRSTPVSELFDIGLDPES